jgi:hypothetical protein
LSPKLPNRKEPLITKDVPKKNRLILKDKFVACHALAAKDRAPSAADAKRQKLINLFFALIKKTNSFF